ncbi:M23 family metallopeptidase [Xylanivirga thermophila]|jgi:murein DD-endopeptidase MepM/ murein hydrolase activator NlpD|uniref:M23 family metallopeptidase n=1 Tax=Xylanivirga thermophila TaxID=2496273 RepID=UPI00101DAB88|nr:M23 family metallopeptidase [Xylanivirga thermophila]
MKTYYSHVKRYRLNKKRFLTVCIVAAVLLLTIIILTTPLISPAQYRIENIAPSRLGVYFDVEKDQGVLWYYLSAIDNAEGISDDKVSFDRSSKIALYLRGAQDHDQVLEQIRSYNDNRAFLKQVAGELKRFEHIDMVYRDKVFPLADGYEYSFDDGFGGRRTYGGERKHEGIDIMCDKGVPLVAVCDGKVEQKGWLELGGWRIGIRGEDGIYYYYAHLIRYEPNIKRGSHVKKGQIIGYAGDSGYGEEGTSGKFLPHLHFGMYEDDKAINPYPFLKIWEEEKISISQ